MARLSAEPVRSAPAEFTDPRLRPGRTYAAGTTLIEHAIQPYDSRAMRDYPTESP